MACILAIAASVRVLVKFKENLLEMRVGRNPYSRMLETVPISSFSCTSTPALCGMVRAPLEITCRPRLLDPRTPRHPSPLPSLKKNPRTQNP